MSDKQESSNVLTPVFRLSFPNLFVPSKPKDAKPEQEKKYSCAMLFALGEDLTNLKREVKRAVKEKWGDSPPKDLKYPFRDQGSKEFDGYVDGAIFITASSKQKPGVVDQNVQKIIDESEIYPGCYCQATVRAFTYGGKGTSFAPGVAFGLQNIQKVKDGEPLGNRTKAEDDFAPIEDNSFGDDDDTDDDLGDMMG